MSFIGQAQKIFGTAAELKFQAVLFGRDAIYLEGVRPVGINDAEMIFKTSGALITLTGERMSVKELDGDCVSVTGKIIGLAVRDL